MIAFPQSSYVHKTHTRRVGTQAQRKSPTYARPDKVNIQIVLYRSVDRRMPSFMPSISRFARKTKNTLQHHLRRHAHKPRKSIYSLATIACLEKKNTSPTPHPRRISPRRYSCIIKSSDFFPLPPHTVCHCFVSLVTVASRLLCERYLVNFSLPPVGGLWRGVCAVYLTLVHSPLLTKWTEKTHAHSFWWRWTLKSVQSL